MRQTTHLGISRSTLIRTALLLYALSQLAFLIGIQFPAKHSFDEFHYVPSAKQFLALIENQNWEHPPLGKELMAIGIGLLGDRPIGWRFMSTIFGSLTLVGMYAWGAALFRNQRSALWVALITFVNSLLYVQARIGMLDTFMFAFVAWGLAAFTSTWDASLDAKQTYRRLLFAGLMFGLGTACKWSSVVPWFFCVGLMGCAAVFRAWGVSFTGKSGPNRAVGDSDFYEPGLWKGVTPARLAIALGLVPLVAYFVTFLPFLFVHREPAYTLWDLVLMQPKMYDGQLRVVTDHPYMSKWQGWPLMLRPIWYAFDKEADERFVRGVLLLGNPVVMWCGLGALAACAWLWLRERSRQAFLIVAFWSMFYLSWAVIPRKVSFYYYYYPAGMTLSLALGCVFHHFEPRGKEKSDQPWLSWAFLGIAAGMFAYFYPILSGMKIDADSFRKWTWFSSWI